MLNKTKHDLSTRDLSTVRLQSRPPSRRELFLPQRRWRALLLVLAVFFTSTPGFAAAEESGALTELLAAPLEARSFEYCSWRFSAGAPESLESAGLPDFETLLGPEREAEPEMIRAGLLVRAGTRIAFASKKLKGCKKVFEKGELLFEERLKKATAKMQIDGFMIFSKEPEVGAAQRQLLKLWVSDQAARRTNIQSRTENETGSDAWTSALSSDWTIRKDSESTAAMKELLEEVDWFDIPTYGEQVSAHAWILVQHADHDPAFQKRVLARMEPYVESGGVSGQNYAYLWDRVAVNHDQLQRYGTQPDWNCNDDKSLDFMPMEDPANVDERRAEFGLGPAQQDLDGMARAVCRKDL